MFWLHIKMPEVWWKWHSRILSTNHHLLQLRLLHWSTFYSGLYWIQTGLDLSVLRGWEVLPSTFLGFGWGFFFLHLTTNILDLQSSARHYLVNNNHCNCSATFFHHPQKKDSCTKSSKEKKSHFRYIVVTELRLLSIQHNVFMQEMVLLFILDSASWWHLFNVLTLCKIQIGCLWTLTPRAAWKFARTYNGCS